MDEDLLKELAVSRGVAVEGGVDVLRARLREHDQQQRRADRYVGITEEVLREIAISRGMTP